MAPAIESGQLVTVEASTWCDVKDGDIVLCRVKGTDFLHYCRGVDAQRGVRVENAKGHLNGYTRTVYGRVVKVED